MTINGTTFALDAEHPPAEVQERAREAYRASVARREPLSRQELGAMFGKSESWGGSRITEVRAEVDSGRAVADTAAPVEAPPALAQASEDDARQAAPAVADSPPDTAVVTGDNPPVTGDRTTADGPGQHHVGARFVCWLGFLLGTGVSVAANWLASWLPAALHGPGWRPDPWAQLFAAVWPMALLVSVEVLSRVSWPSGKGWGLVRYGGMVAVALCSGVISYGHIHEVLLSWGYGAVGAAVGPLVIDGLMVVSGFGLLALSKGKRR